VPSLVPGERLVTANSVVMSTAQFTEIVAPAPAGIVIKTLGVAWAFFLDAISFLFVIGALWRMPEPPSQVKTAVAKKAVWQDIAERNWIRVEGRAAAFYSAAGDDYELL
jgi:Transmembrane secretion effector